MLVVEKCSSGLLTIDGLTPTGLELFRISYDGKKLQYDKKVNSGHDIPVTEILFDSMATRLPLEDLKENIPTSWTIREQKDSREILDENGIIVETIHKSDDSEFPSATIINHSFHYEIELQMLEKE